jgi:hypothetical protein
MSWQRWREVVNEYETSVDIKIDRTNAGSKEN